MFCCKERQDFFYKAKVTFLFKIIHSCFNVFVVGAPRAGHLAGKQRDSSLPTKGPKPPIKGLCILMLLPRFAFVIALKRYMLASRIGSLLGFLEKKCNLR